MMNHEERTQELRRLEKEQAAEHRAWDEWREASADWHCGIVSRERVAMLAEVVVRASVRKEQCRNALRATLFGRRARCEPFADMVERAADYS